MKSRTILSAVYYLILILAVLWSLASLDEITIEGNILSSLLPADNSYQQMELEHEDLFTTTNAVILFVSPIDGNELVWDDAFLRELESVRQELLDSEFFRQAVTVTNLTTLPEGDTIEAVPLVDLTDQKSIEQAGNICQDVDILRQMFLSYDTQALMIYAVPADDADRQQLGLFLDGMKRDREREGTFIALMGGPYQKHMVQEMIISQLKVISPISMLLIMLFFLGISHDFRTTVLLTFFSGIPTLLIFGFYALMGYTMDTLGILLPVVLFSLTTAYSIHLYKGYSSHPESVHAVVQDLRLIIIFAASTTMLGYVNLVFLPNESYRHLGTGLVIGIILSVLLVFTVMPQLFRFIPLPKRVGWEVRLRTMGFSGSRKPVMLLSGLFLLILIGLVWLIGPFNYAQAYNGEFKSYSRVEQMLQDIELHSRRPITLNVYIDAEDEYGLIDPEVFFGIDSLAEKLKAHDAVISLISYTDLTEYGNGLLYGVQEDVPPGSIEEIGETLELLASQEVAVPLSMLITPDYRQTVLQLTFSVDGVDRNDEVPLYRELEGMVESALAPFDSVTSFIAGDPVRNHEIVKEITHILLRSVALFIIIVLAFGSLSFRSFRKGLLLLFPTFVGMAVFAGMTGWLHKNVDINLLFSFYTFLGISIDDTSYLLFSSSSPEYTGKGLNTLVKRQDRLFQSTGVSIMETTSMLVLGLSPLLFVCLDDISRAIAIAIISYGFSTITTLFIVPRFPVIFGRNTL